MKSVKFIGCVALVLALGTAAYAEDYRLLRAKAELLVEQAKEFCAESANKGSSLHTPQFQYYFGLMSTAGTNLLARSQTTTNRHRLEQFCELIGKDYEAYTKAESATEMAAATGGSRRRGKSDARHRAKRLINAEKLGEKELLTAIGRWEKFIVDIQKDPKEKVKASVKPQEKKPSASQPKENSSVKPNTAK